jgi:excisionase family DNA binding protein
MIKNKNNYLTSAEAAQILGFSHDYVRKLILQGKLKAEKLGRNWIIEKKNLDKIHRQRFPKPKESIENGINE